MTNDIITTYDNTSIQVDTTSEAWVTAWGMWLSDLRPNTRDAYSLAWRQFREFCHDMGVGMIHPAHVTREHMQAWKLSLSSAGKSDSTIVQKLAALSSFYIYVMTHYPHMRDDNPAASVKRPNVNPYGKATYLHGDEDMQMLSVIDTTTLNGLRDFAMILTYLVTGLRASAVAEARVGDIVRNVSKSYLEFTNKGGTVKRKYLPVGLQQAIAQYMSARGTVEDSEPLFDLRNDITGKPIKSAPRHKVRQIIMKYCNEAFGVGHGITTHSLRHTAAINMVREGATLTQIRDVLGQSSARVTTIYLDHLSSDAEQEVIGNKLDGRYS